MDKKTIIIAVVAVAVNMLFIVMRDKASAETVADTITPITKRGRNTARCEATTRRHLGRPR